MEIEQLGSARRRPSRRWLAAMAGLALVAAGFVAAQPAAADTPWLTITTTANGTFARWTVPNDYVQSQFGTVSQVVARGSFGPSDDWAQINLTRSGSNWTEQAGPLKP